MDKVYQNQMKNYKQFYGIKNKLKCDLVSHLRVWLFPKSKHWPKATMSCLEAFLLQHVEELGKSSRNLLLQEWTINVSMIGKSRMKSLNMLHRNKNYATDVLSFPSLNWSDKKYLKQSAEIAQYNLGDIVICKDVMQQQAKQFKLSEMDEYLHLLVHGFLHLLGYDHETSANEAKIMENYEKVILEDIGRHCFVRK